MADSPHKKTAVGPSNTFAKDARAGADKFDRWLRSISDGHVTLERLSVAAGAVPVIGNAMAAIDAVFAVRDIAQKKNSDVFDWMNLSISIIGILPGAGNAVRTTMRPMLHLLRDQARRHGSLLAEAAVTAIVNHILAGHQADAEKFVETGKKQIEPWLREVARYARRSLNSSADALTKIAAGELFDTAHLHRQAGAAYDKATIRTAPGRNQYEIAARYKSEAITKDAANAVVKRLVPAGIKTKLTHIAVELRRYGATADTRIIQLAATLIQLLGMLATALQKRKRGGSTAAVPGQAAKSNPNARLDASTKQNRATDKPAPCKSCGTGASPHSIDFATGQETLSHTDFTLPGLLPISWSRTYCSGLISYQQGEQGARWITPYTARIGIRRQELLYHTTDGRAVSFPLLEPGKAWHHPVEDFTLARINEDLLTLNVGKELLEVYEKHGKHFRLSAIRDRNGNSLGFHYQGGRLVGINDSNGHTVGLSYNAQGKISRIDLLGDKPRLLAEYHYNPEGDLTEAVDENGDSRSYAYQNHLLTRYSDRTGRGINLEWRGRRHRARCIREYADDGSSDIRLSWDEDIREVAVADAYGNETAYQYDAEGYTCRIIYPDHSEEWFYRDERKNITCHIHPDGSEDQYSYDEHDNLLEHTRADNSRVAFEYDGDNNLITVTDPQGHRWQREYDGNGNMVKETDPEEQETRYTYNERGLPVGITDAKGGLKTLTWTSDGQISSHTDCSGSTTRWAYDGRGLLAGHSDAEGHTTRYQYDHRGQLSSQTRADGTQEHYRCDAEGRLLEYTDPLAHTTAYTYDAAGRVAERNAPLDNRVRYQYDKTGRLAVLTDANGSQYRFRYNSIGAVTEETGFDGKTTRYRYAEGSGVLLETDEAGTVTAFGYDAAGRIESRSIRTTGSDGQSRDSLRESYSYDPAGRLAEARNAHSHFQYHYDSLGNLVKEYQHHSRGDSRRSYVWHHRYDELGNRIETVRPDGQRIGYLRYGSGHLHGITLNQKEIAAFERDRLHRETERTTGASTRHTRYDPLGRILQQNDGTHSRDYSYDQAGRLTHIRSNRGHYSYRYDPLDRLTAATGPQGEETFAFDPAGNRLDPQRDGSPKSSKVWDNLLKQYAGSHYRYDERGNLAEKSENGHITRYHWNGYNQLVKLENQNGETEYRYDPLGRRLSKTHNGHTTVYLWQEDTLAVETTAESSTHYLFEPDSFEPLAQFQTAAVTGIPSPSRIVLPYSYDPATDPLLKEPEMPAIQPELTYYRLDHLGTPTAAHNEAGETVWEATYKAWGKIESENVSDGLKQKIPFRFQGQYYDEESGLHYNRFRYYDPDIGRFISQDPIGLMGGENLYAYAPNPMGWVDPLGLSPRCRYSPNMHPLEKMAHAIHGESISPSKSSSNNARTFNSMTIAVAKLQDSKGKTSLVAASSKGYMSSTQQTKAKMLGVSPISIPNVTGAGGHAERNIIDRYAKQHGMKVMDIAASRDICCSCNEAIVNHGANPQSPIKKKRR